MNQPRPRHEDGEQGEEPGQWVGGGGLHHHKGGRYIDIYIGIDMMYNALMQHCKSFDGAIRDGIGGKFWGIHIYSLDDCQSRNHGLLIPSLCGLRVVSGSLQKQHGNKEK